MPADQVRCGHLTERVRALRHVGWPRRSRSARAGCCGRMSALGTHEVLSNFAGARLAALYPQASLTPHPGPLLQGERGQRCHPLPFRGRGWMKGVCTPLEPLASGRRSASPTPVNRGLAITCGEVPAESWSAGQAMRGLSLCVPPRLTCRGAVDVRPRSFACLACLSTHSAPACAFAKTVAARPGPSRPSALCGAFRSLRGVWRA